MDSVRLVGTEEVSRAASRIMSAAETISSAVSTFDCAVERMGRILNNFEANMMNMVERLEALK